MHCDLVFFKEVSLQLFSTWKQRWGSLDGYGDVVPDPGCIDGKGLFSFFALFSLQSDGVMAGGAQRTTRDDELLCKISRCILVAMAL